MQVSTGSGLHIFYQVCSCCPLPHVAKPRGHLSGYPDISFPKDEHYEDGFIFNR